MGPMSTPQTTVVHLLRHGEVENPTRVLYGRLPGFRLSRRGQAMARLAADHLGDHDIVHVASSPLDRARQTAEPIASDRGLPVTTDERLVEADNWFEGTVVGQGDGILKNPRAWAKLINPFKPSWGEPYEQIAARMLAAIADARALAQGHEAVLVSHQLPVWTARSKLEGHRLWHDPRRRVCALASLTSLHYQGDALLSVEYTEPAAALLPGAGQGAGA